MANSAVGAKHEKRRQVTAMHVRVGPAVKATAVRLAREDGRSLANWLERLIEAEAARLDNKK
jgi:predicted HicB family RNase H-like nuclease